MISTWPLLILVAMFKACMKEVCCGSRPVGPFGTMTSQGETEPTLAGAET